ncbi:DUF1003 domain-containing protein [Cellulomonas sp. Marseille-Q8402]
MAERLDTPKTARRSILPKLEEDAFGKVSEGIARFMGTPKFLLWLSLFCLAWLTWNSWGPDALRFDKAANGFTALTLMLSLQASYAAPLILLAQNRQSDRDRVQAEQDRQRAERNLADTEFLAREMAALRIALSEVATRDFVRSEIRNLLEELVEDREQAEDDAADGSRDRAERDRVERGRADRARDRDQRAAADDRGRGAPA